MAKIIYVYHLEGLQEFLTEAIDAIDAGRLRKPLGLVWSPDDNGWYLQRHDRIPNEVSVGIFATAAYAIDALKKGQVSWTS